MGVNPTQTCWISRRAYPKCPLPSLLFFEIVPPPGERIGARERGRRGAVVGVSTINNDTSYPTLWPAGSASGVALPISLLALVGLGNTNCVAVIWIWTPGLLGGLTE